MNKKLKITIKWLGIICGLLLSAFWALYAMRHAGVVFFGIVVISLVLLPIHKKWRIVIISWVLFLVVTLIPIDVRFDNNPEIKPRVIPILWGLPSAEGRKLIDEGKYYSGGCSVTGWMPKWVLVL